MSTTILSPIDLTISLMAIPLLPLAFYALAIGSPAPPGTFLAKYFRAEPLLGPVGNLFLISACLVHTNKLAAHFGLVDASLFAFFDRWLLGISGALLLIDLVVWIRAAIRVRRGAGPEEASS